MKDQRDFSNIKILYRYEEWINRDSDVCVQFAKFEIILAFVEATMNLIFVGGSKSVNWVLSVAITKDGTSQPSPIRLSVFYPDASHPEDITHPPSKS
jgi:hypothetical protein